MYPLRVARWEREKAKWEKENPGEVYKTLKPSVTKQGKCRYCGADSSNFCVQCYFVHYTGELVIVCKHCIDAHRREPFYEPRFDEARKKEKKKAAEPELSRMSRSAELLSKWWIGDKWKGRYYGWSLFLLFG